MTIYEFATLILGIALVAAPAFALALLKRAWRRPAWVGLKVVLVALVASMGAAIATLPPQEVRDAKAAARAARAEQASREKAERDAAESAAKAAQRERTEREHSEKAAAAAEAKRAAEAEVAKKKVEEQRQAEAELAALRAPKPMTHDAIGCLTRDANDRLTKIAVSGDKEAFTKLATALVATSQCRFMKAGTRLYLDDTAIFSGLMCGRPVGETRCYWLPIEITK